LNDVKRAEKFRKQSGIFSCTSASPHRLARWLAVPARL
jgi:hypothetical protein